jgi:hypothetical protein
LDLDKYVLKIAMQLAEITAVSCLIHQIEKKLTFSSPPQSLPRT